MTRLRQSRRLAFAWLLFAAAVVARAAMPAGWMPSVDQGGVRVLLCTGYGPVSVLLDADGQLQEEEPQQETRHDPCPFGVATAKAFDLPQALALDLPASAFSVLSGPALAAARLAAWRSLRPPARGPPILA